MIIYAFDSKEEADAGERKRYVNYVKYIFGEGEPVRGDKGLVSTLEGLSDEQIGQLKVCAYKDGKVDLVEGLSDAYVTVRPAFGSGLGKYYFPTLEGEYMEGVISFTEMERPADWVHRLL